MPRSRCSSLPSGRGRDWMAWTGDALFGQLEERHADLLAAMQWFLDQGRTDEAVELASALARFWTESGRLEEGSQSFGRALAAPGGADAKRGRACFEAGLIEFWRGADDRACALHRQSLEIGRRAGDATATALALTGLARIALRSNRGGEAQRLCREALAASEGGDNPLGRANALHVLGVAAQMAGELGQAREFMTERMALARQLDNMGASPPKRPTSPWSSTSSATSAKPALSHAKR